MATPTPALESRRAPALKQIPLDLIRIRKQHNFRQDFDQTELQELADSIKKQGMLQPVVLRYHDALKGRIENIAYQLVAGERRVRAARLAGLKEVPAIVRELTDAEADEIMVIENLQRKDLSVLEYADGFSRMITTHGYTVEQLATKAHKGTTFIRDLLHLAKLPKSAREAVQSERITKSVAVLISTIPDEGQREKFAKVVIQGSPHYKEESAMSFRKAKEYKERYYMKVLSGAPFSLDEVIDPAWPHSCKTCPHFAGNANDNGKQGKRSDVCLNPPHYEHLVQITAEQKRKAFETKGETVLSPSDSKRIFNGPYHGEKRYRLRYDEKKYVDSNDTFYDGKYKSHQYSSIVKKGGLTPIIAVDPGGSVHRLLERSKAEAAIVKLGLKKRESSKSPSQMAHDKARREKNAVQRAMAAEIFLQLGATAPKGFVFGVAPLQVKRLLYVALMTIKDADSDLCKFLCAQLNLERTKSQYSYEYRKPLADYVQNTAKNLRVVKGSQAEFLWTFLVRILVFEKLSYLFNEWGRADNDCNQYASAFGLDLVKIKREQSSLLKANQKKAPAKRAKKAKR